MIGFSRQADALWRAITYIAVAELHLLRNPLLRSPLSQSDVKPNPSGHWGTVPGVAWILAHTGLTAGTCPNLEIVPVLGAGHAGVAQTALAWLIGDLSRLRPRFSRDANGLAALVASFPDLDGLGSEVHPDLPAGSFVGGALGGALAFAQGAALDSPRILVPIVGDGECETPTTAAAWLGQRALSSSAKVLPVVHLNGHRMGGTSLLGSLTDSELHRWAEGLGWSSTIVHITDGLIAEHEAFHTAFHQALADTQRDRRHLLYLRCRKGWSGPLGAHKTPLTDAAKDSYQRLLLERWLLTYRPGELLDQDGQPRGDLQAALNSLRLGSLRPRAFTPRQLTAQARRGFSARIGAVLRAYAEAGDLKVFSPDELASNKLGDLAGLSWVHELLAEEVLLGWLAGWTASGGRGVLISYEAFAPLMLTGLIGLLKQRRLGSARLPSINLLLTSYGWHNAYTHGDPSLITALVATRDTAIRVFTPADSVRAAVALDDCLLSAGAINIVLVGKHAAADYPLETIEEERKNGLAIWPHLSDHAEPDLTIVCAGDIPAAVATAAVGRIRRRNACAVRVVNVHRLTALGEVELDGYLGTRSAVLFLTLGHPAAVWGLLSGRLHQPTEVIGWREPPHPMSQSALAAHARLDVDGVAEAADVLLGQRAGAQ